MIPCGSSQVIVDGQLYTVAILAQGWLLGCVVVETLAATQRRPDSNVSLLSKHTLLPRVYYLATVNFYTRWIHLLPKTRTNGL